jgi:hypothetical protein
MRGNTGYYQQVHQQNGHENDKDGKDKVRQHSETDLFREVIRKLCKQQSIRNSLVDRVWY